MIEFSDRTLQETGGYFSRVNELMCSEGPSTWMLETIATVITPNISSEFLLHLWNDKSICIMNTSHPITMGAPDDDLRFLQEWSSLNDWQIPKIHKYLLESPQGFDFWLRIYYIGLIQSEVLQKHEQDDIKRMSQIIDHEED